MVFVTHYIVRYLILSYRTAGRRGRRGGDGSSYTVTWYEPEGRYKTLSLELIVGHELNVQPVAGRCRCLVVVVITELL